MPISGRGWELHLQRLAEQVAGSKMRTYGTYQAYQDGKPLDGLSGYICECVGPGENTVAGSAKRIAQGNYPLSTQFGEYRTIGYSEDTSTPGRHPMPGILLRDTGHRSGVLIHPGHPPNLYLSSIGCLNPTRGLLSWQSMDFWDSRKRVIALIEDLRRFAPDAFKTDEDTAIEGASIVIDGEPSNAAVAPAETVSGMSLTSFDAAKPISLGVRRDETVASKTSTPSSAVIDPASASQAHSTLDSALKAVLEQIEAKKEAKLPDGKSFFFPEGIRSLEIVVATASEIGVTVRINEGS